MPTRYTRYSADVDDDNNHFGGKTAMTTMTTTNVVKPEQRKSKVCMFDKQKSEHISPLHYK